MKKKPKHSSHSVRLVQNPAESHGIFKHHPASNGDIYTSNINLTQFDFIVVY